MQAQGLIGRTIERKSLVALLRSAASGAGSSAVIEGEPGIGKSALLADALGAARSLGFTIYHAAADELAQARAFGAIGAALGSLPAEGAARDEEARLRVVDAILDTVESRAAQAPVVVVVDDVHWADSSTVLALRALVRAARPLWLAVLVARRRFPSSPDLEALALDIREAAGLTLPLEPFSRADVATLAERILGARPDAALMEAVSGAGGNPLFVQELLLAMSDEGSIAVAGESASVAAPGLPVSLALAVLRRIALLPPSTIELLGVASVLGTSWTAADLAVVLGRRPSDLMGDLRPALASGLLADDGSRLFFRHALIREAVYGDLGAGRKALHLQAARALAAAGAPNDRVATQFALGAEPGDEEAVSRLQLAAAEAGGRAPAIAVRLLRRALELAPASRRPDLVGELVRWLTWSGDIEEARRLAAGSLALVDGGLAARLKISIGKTLAWSGRPAESLGHVEEALRLPGLPSDVRAEILAELALRRCHSLDVAGMREAAAATLALPDAAPACAASAWIAKGFADVAEGRVADGVDAVRRGVQVARLDSSEQGYLDGPLGYLGMVFCEADRLSEAEAAFGEARLDIERRGMLWNMPVRQGLFAMLRFYEGRWEEAAVDAESSLRLSDETGIRSMALLPAAVLARIAVHHGDLPAATAVLERAGGEVAASGPGRIGVVALLVAKAELLDATGRTAEAVQLLAGTLRLCAHLGALGASRDALMPLARIAASETALLQQAAAHAATLASRGAPASVAGAAALLAALAAREPTGVAHAAARDWARPLEQALALETAAAAAATAADTAQAASLGDRAIAAYERLGAALPVTRLQRLLRDLGVRRGARGRRGREALGWDALTASERRVAELAAQGLTNPAIAARLYVGRATVATHLSHVFAKLGISSRVELAGVVALGNEGRHRSQEL